MLCQIICVLTLEDLSALKEISIGRPGPFNILAASIASGADKGPTGCC